MNIEHVNRVIASLKKQVAESKTPEDNACVVVLSGGQDSTTCLGLALAYYDRVHAICFNYGQKHMVEMMCAQKICDMYHVNLELVDVPALRQIGNSALISGSTQDVNEKHSQNSSLPASFVPNRNAMFLTIAHAYAQKVGANNVMTGVCETDYSGYPDCRERFVRRLEATLNCGYMTDIKFVTPLMSLTKAETFLLADKVQFLEVVLEHSHTCYNGDHTNRHAYGYGCNDCPACKLRAAGYAEFEKDQEGAL